MKNEDIHKRFSQTEIRDFLARELRNAYREGGGGNEKYIEEQIKQFQEYLKMTKKANAIKTIIKEKGWKEWDLSDNIPYDPKTYFGFLGTEEEYKEIMEQIKKKK